MTDARQYKCPTPRSVAIGGRTFEVRALSPLVLDDAREAARLQARGEAAAKWIGPMEVVHLLARATGESTDTLHQLYPEHLGLLLHAWHQAQSAATPDIDRLDAHIRLVMFGVYDDPEFQDPDLILDGSVAHAAQSPADYYGRPMGELTLGQLAYYHLLRAAFHEIRVERGATTKVSKRWLQRLAAKARGG